MTHADVATAAVRSADAPIDRAIERALDHLRRWQLDSGAFPGDYGGPMFLLPMYVGTCHGVGVELDGPTRDGMARYLRGNQRPDGGWGLHAEGPSHVFTSALVYVALRLLGEQPATCAMARARGWLRRHGGPRAAAPWGKFFLALLNLYDYEGLEPVPPELWLLPRGVPLHPSGMWCHTRMVYLPMSYLYGVRQRAPLDDTLRALRRELYDEPYAQIDWRAARGQLSGTDAYRPTTRWMAAVNRVLRAHERRPALRARALGEVLRQIRHEDRNTDYVCLGPVNKLLHLWVWKHARPEGPELARHLARLDEYLYRAEDGVKMQGYHSSQLWDTAFAAQAVIDSGHAARERSMLRAAHGFVDRAQILHDVVERERCYRDPTCGGWGFSDRDNGWAVSDCTAEGLKAALALAPYVPTPLSHERLRAALDLLLWMQTDDGGWASYEPPRGPRWLERLNPANCFGDIMVDYSYVECTASCVEALAAYRARYPGERDAAIAQAVARAQRYLLARQRPDGSFEGSWGVCFTYGTWFGVAGLRASGLPAGHPAVRRACEFLVSRQRPDGGWGETAASNRTGRYVAAERGHAVQTAWALMALVEGGRARSEAVRRGADFVCRSQRADGRWEHGQMCGMFNRTCAIHYDNYARVFPLWALARVRRAWSAQPAPGPAAPRGDASTRRSLVPHR